MDHLVIICQENLTLVTAISENQAIKEQQHKTFRVNLEAVKNYHHSELLLGVLLNIEIKKIEHQSEMMILICKKLLSHIEIFRMY